MGYRATVYFTDLQDNNFEYHVGDEYPRHGYTPSESRIAELASTHNKRGRAVIEEVKDSFMNEPVEVDEQPAEIEASKPKKKGKKKNADGDMPRNQKLV